MFVKMDLLATYKLMRTEVIPTNGTQIPAIQIPEELLLLMRKHPLTHLAVKMQVPCIIMLP